MPSADRRRRSGSAVAASADHVALVAPFDEGHRFSVAGRSIDVADVMMGAAAFAWLVFVVAITARRELVPSDDAFISFQYARNLGQGHGLVFNQGERVWGFTSPLQTLVLGLLTSIGFETMRAAFVTAFLWVAVAAVLLYCLGSQLLPRTLALWLGVLFLLDRSQHGNYGLESNLLIAVQLAFLLAATTSKGRLANLFGGLSCLVRPDSVLLVLPILLAGRETRKLTNLAWFAAIGMLWEGFAFLYYGELVPNSYHAKSGLSQFGPFLVGAVRSVTGVTFADDLGFAANPSTLGRILVVALSALALLNSRVRRHFAHAYALLLYPWLLLGAYSYIGSFPGHDWEFYSARFFLRVSAGIGLLSLGRYLAAKWHAHPDVRWVVTAWVFLFVIANGALRTAAMAKQFAARDTSYWGGARYETYRRIADWANENLPNGSTIAMSEVGTFAYFTNQKVIDVSGIVTRGYLPTERMDHGRFMLRFLPTYAVVYGDRQEMRLSPSLRYRRVVYFPKQGFEDFSIMAIDRS